MTTSIVLSTLSKVCFVVLFRTLRAGENINMGGLAPKTLKKLKGDRLGLPSLSKVLAKAMGLGPTAPNKIPCSLVIGMSGTWMETISFIAYKDSKYSGKGNSYAGKEIEYLCPIYVIFKLNMVVGWILVPKRKLRIFYC